MKNRRFVYLVIAIACIVLFYGFSRAVKGDFLKQTDFDTTVKLQERIDKSSRLRLADFAGNVFEGATYLAGPEISVLITALITIPALYDRKKKRLRWKAAVIPILFGVLVLGEIYGKSVVHHPAPPFFMIKNPTTIFPKFYINEQYSYPSGHAARAVFNAIALGAVAYLYGDMTKKRRNWIITVSCIYVVLVSLSRIYLGHHWLSDVVGGLLLGSGTGLLAIVAL